MLFYFACEAAGASSARHSLHPSDVFRWQNLQAKLARMRSEIAKVCVGLPPPSLRAKRSNPPSIWRCRAMDCFASLAMTATAFRSWLFEIRIWKSIQVFARSNAAKQSIFDLVEPWIVSLRSQ
jgi:hypothetical protein